MVMHARTETKPMPAPITDHYPRCQACGCKLAEYASRPWYFTCRRCKAQNYSDK